LLTVASLLEAVLVATAVALTAAVGDPTLGAPRYVLIALLGLAMGIQNASARNSPFLI
jgi:uncharacterized membrane protein YoaK (UPF0700 family)